MNEWQARRNLFINRGGPGLETWTTTASSLAPFHYSLSQLWNGEEDANHLSILLFHE